MKKNKGRFNNFIELIKGKKRLIILKNMIIQ